MGGGGDYLETGSSSAPIADAYADVLPANFRVGSYIIQSVLGCGGFGITYLARHEHLNKLFAIKEHFPRQFAHRDGQTVRPTMRSEKTYEWGLDRFLQEARKLALFRHPAIVGVNNIFEAHGTAYMVLDYEQGEDLAAWFKSLGRPPTQAELDRLIIPLLDAVDLMHGHDMLHRDIAPDNIMVRPDGSPVLIDFGSAREDIRAQSQMMSAIVKYRYSPPEQYSRESIYQGPWSDVYALGATLYQAVTGAPPIEAAERKIEDHQIPAVKAAKGEYRASFLRAIDWALDLEFKKRPQTIVSWRLALLQDGPQGIPNSGRYDAPPKPAQKQQRTGGKRYLPVLLSGVAVLAGGILLASLNGMELPGFGSKTPGSQGGTVSDSGQVATERKHQEETERLRAETQEANKKSEVLRQEAERSRRDADEARSREAAVRQREEDARNREFERQAELERNRAKAEAEAKSRSETSVAPPQQNQTGARLVFEQCAIVLEAVLTCEKLRNCSLNSVRDNFTDSERRYFSSIEGETFTVDSFYDQCRQTCDDGKYKLHPVRAKLCGY